MINITMARLRWLVRERKYLTLDGAAEIARAAPDLLAEIERLSAGTGWRTMESAPKDGTKIDLWCEDRCSKGLRIPNCYWIVDGMAWAGPFPQLYGPYIATHWRPLPPPPNKGEGE